MAEDHEQTLAARCRMDLPPAEALKADRALGLAGGEEAA